MFPTWAKRLSPSKLIFIIDIKWLTAEWGSSFLLNLVSRPVAPASLGNKEPPSSRRKLRGYSGIQGHQLMDS